MSNSELFLMTVVFVLTLIASFFALYVFIRQYKREMQAKAAAAQEKKQALKNAEIIKE